MDNVVLNMILFMMLNWKGLLWENSILDSEKIKTLLQLFARFSLFYLYRDALGMTQEHNFMIFQFSPLFIGQ